MNRMPHVGIDLELAYDTYRFIFDGVLDYAQHHGPWRVATNPSMGFGSLGPVHEFRGDGLITQDYHSESVDAARASGVLVVPVSDTRLEITPELVHSDRLQILRLQLRHLRRCGYRHLMVVSGTSSAASRAAYDAAPALAVELGCDGDHFHRWSIEAWPRRAAELTEMLVEKMRDWPRPVGVAMDFDGRAVSIVATAAQLGIQIPTELGVIGVNNDTMLCKSCRPTLTSVAVDAHRIGYEAAARLDQMMRGDIDELEPMLIPPRGVVERGSTSIFAIDDPGVVAAVSHIREYLSDRITRTNVADKVGLTRRQLDNVFNNHLGHTVAEEIRQSRLARVRQLLRDTDLTMAHIAAAAGYTDQTAMGVAFKKAEGVTPTAFRQEQRGEIA